MRRLELVTRTLAIVFAATLVFYLGFIDTAPFTVSQHYGSGSKHITALSPGSRLITVNGYLKQIDNYTYFNNDMSFEFDTATTHITFKSPYPDQEIDLGYRDQATWHYNSQIISAPFIDAVGWGRVGAGPYLYQKVPVYGSAQALVDKPPTDKVIGVYDYDASGLNQPAVSLPDYAPTTGQTVITTPLRGQVTMYVYLDGEPFDLSIQKRDLNWYVDPDVATVNIYKGTKLVLGTTIPDDGDTAGDHKLGPAITAELKNPGPTNPEPGVYKVVIAAPGDSVITRIATNLHKVVFAGPLYPVSNHEVYGDIVPKTTPNTITTNALSVSLVTYHQAPKALTINGHPVQLAHAQAKVLATIQPPPGGLNTIVLPTSDVTLGGAGYFAFSPGQFFAPTPYQILPLTDAADVTQVDYILTNYRVPRDLGGGWQQATTDFDLAGAVIQKGQLSWLLSAPGLSDNQGEVDIKSISMDLSKQGWWKR